MRTPTKKLSVKKPIKLIFAGGFLGSGKTTALAALVKHLIERGKRVGFITNDQSENLVDTIYRKKTDCGLRQRRYWNGWMARWSHFGPTGGQTVLSRIDYDRYATAEAGIEADIVKKWTLSEEIREKYGLLLSPALAIEGVVVAQGKVYKPERIAGLLSG